MPSVSLIASLLVCAFAEGCAAAQVLCELLVVIMPAGADELGFTDAFVVR